MPADFDESANAARYGSLPERPVAPLSRPFEVTEKWREIERAAGEGKSADEMQNAGLCLACRGGGFVGFERGGVWGVDGRDGKLVRCVCRAGEKILREDERRARRDN